MHHQFVKKSDKITFVRPAQISEQTSGSLLYGFFFHFWLPAASGGAALEANITVVLLLLLTSFTQNLLLSLFSIIITQHFSVAQNCHCLTLALLSICFAQHLALLSISIAQYQHCLALASLCIRISQHQYYSAFVLLKSSIALD